ncbi:hypothetical protein BGZ52_004600, partial [Haplosporangium bisporale]
MADLETSREYNILCLGESQSGKSTLLEFLKKYADPDYIINRKYVGDGIFSFTTDVQKTTIHTHLPSSFVVDKDTNERIDYGKFFENDQEDYEDEFNDRRSYEMRREQPSADNVTFNLYDTPGLNNSTLFDENNIAIIFKSLEKEKVQSINPVIITVAITPFTEDLENALKAYVNLLQELNGNVVFVHTKIDYSKLHPEEHLFVLTLREKQRIIHGLMGRDTVPHLLIDNDIGSPRTIQNCMTQNKLRELLAMAMLIQPISLQVMVVHKTEKMKIVDAILQEKFTQLISESEGGLARDIMRLKEPLPTIARVTVEIAKYEQDLRNIRRDLIFYDRETLVLLHEERYDQVWSKMMYVDFKTAMYYPERTLKGKPKFINHVLDHIETQEHNIEVIQQAGGVDDNHWAVKFDCKGPQNGFYHVKIYISKKKMFAALIKGLRAKEAVIADLLAKSKSDLHALEGDELAFPEQVKEIIEKLVESRSYANPLHSIDQGLIGNTLHSKTGIPKRFNVTSDLPTYEVCSKDSEIPINTEALCASSINNRKTTLRLAQQNPDHRLSGPVTIQFLDTPGIEDTNCRDLEYAQEVIKEMIKIRSFNLIVVLVNIDTPINLKQQIAFRYYSNVIHTLQRDHSNIIFVYSHVEDLSREEVIVGLATAIQDKDAYLYPHYTIDLRSHRPICKCMMQETLRDILRLAVAKPAVSFDISQENLDRVWAIKYPDENHKCREKQRAREQAEELMCQKLKAEGKEHEPVLLDDVVEAEIFIKAQTTKGECQESDMPDWSRLVFDSDFE